jgi:serine protease
VFVPQYCSRFSLSYVETDGIIMPDAEAFPVGIKVSQGGSRTAIHRTTASAGSGGACNDPNSFKVAIVDSGLQGNHPDLPCRNVNAADSNCIGESFGVGNLPWFAPGAKAWHGTHVFGTMAANGDNDQGVTSMVPDSEASDICYMIIRVFDDDGNGQFASVLFEGIDWAISQGANVINMSLSGGSKYMTGQATFDRAHAAGILSVAAAGNGGSASLRYPASYNHVISVAATDNWG